MLMTSVKQFQVTFNCADPECVCQYFRRVPEGMPNKQIARALGISVRTVTVHVSNLLRKTGASSRTEAVLWALSGDHQVGRRDNRTAARSQSSA